MSLGKRIKQARELQGITLEQLEDRSGVSVGTINALENRNSERSKYASQIAKALGFTTDQLMDPDFPLDKGLATSPSEASYVGKAPARTLIPVLGIAQLGENGWYEEVQSIGSEGYIEHFSNDAEAYVLKVKGDSMFPAIRNNWYVVVEPNAAVVIGEYVAIRQTDGRKMVKELLNKNSEEVSLMSVNGGNRLTVPLEKIDVIHAVAAVVSPSKHKDI